MNISSLLKWWPIIDDPATIALIGDIQIDVSNPAALLDPAVLRPEMVHLADLLAVLANDFPTYTGLKKLHDFITVFWGIPTKVQGLATDAVAALRDLITNETTQEEATALASQWLSNSTGIPVSSFGAILLFLVKLIVKLLLA